MSEAVNLAYRNAVISAANFNREIGLKPIEDLLETRKYLAKQMLESPHNESAEQAFKNINIGIARYMQVDYLILAGNQ